MSLSDLILELNNFDPAELSSLEMLQEKFINAYLSWQTVSAFEFGPAGETSALLRSNINTFPTNSTKIESNIQNNDYNLDAALILVQRVSCIRLFTFSYLSKRIVD